MKQVVAIVLIGVGVLLALVAPGLKWFIAPQLAVAPLSCDPGPLCDDGVTISPSTGLATTLFDPATLSPRSSVQLQQIRRVRPDQAASTGADHRTVYDSFQNVTDPDGVTVDAGTERIAFDGSSSVMIDCCGANENGVPITDFTGLNPYKFPFGTKKQTYQYFDGTLNKPLPAEYVGTEQLQGLTVYKFVQTIPATKYAELEVPGDLVGQPDVASVTAPRFYQNVRTMWVEPVTGAIVNGQEVQKQFLAGADGTTEAMVILDGTLAFTELNVSESVKQAADGKKQLDLIQKTIPLVLLVVGLILVAGGFFLLLRKDDGAHTA